MIRIPFEIADESANPKTTNQNEQSNETFSFVSDKNTLDQLKEDDTVAFNSVAEKEFCHFVCSYLDENQKATQREIIQESSFELNISPVTAKRYLFKHTAKNARFGVVNQLVVCKVHNHSKRYEIKVIKK